MRARALSRPAVRWMAAAAVIVAAAGLGGCSRPSGGATSGAFPSLPDAGPGSAAPQRVEVSVDGRRRVFDGDGRDFPASADFSDGGRVLTLAVRDPEGRFALVITVRGPEGGPVQAGRLAAAQCAGASAGAAGNSAPCAWRGTAAVLGLPMVTLDAAGTTPPSAMAWDLPALGLSPATLDLDAMEDVVRPGAGPGRRLRGRFAGTFAAVTQDDAGRPRLRGPVHAVSGTIDVYASLR